MLDCFFLFLMFLLLLVHMENSEIYWEILLTFFLFFGSMPSSTATSSCTNRLLASYFFNVILDLKDSFENKASSAIVFFPWFILSSWDCNDPQSSSILIVLTSLDYSIATTTQLNFELWDCKIFSTTCSSYIASQSLFI